MADLGTDIGCVADSTPEMTEVSGRLCLAQAIARRLMTPRGRLIYDKNYGFDLTGYVNDDLSPADIARIQTNVQAECVKDERVLDADVTITLTGAGILICKIVLTDADGPFALVLSVNDVTVEVLSVK